MPIATDTFYPEAHPETNSVDGWTAYTDPNGDSSTATWTDVITSAGNSHIDSSTTGTACFFRSSTNTDRWRNNYRSIILFVTSSIPDSAIILSATLSLYGGSKGDDLNVTPTINIYAASPASVDDLVNADYSTLGVAPCCDTAITHANWNTNGWNNFVLNTTGKANINKTGATKIGITHNYDATATDPAWSSAQTTWAYFQTAEGANAPKLEVTYKYTDNTSNGYIWVEGTDLHYIGGDVERSFTGTATGGTGTAGYMWTEGTYIHYIDENGDERREEGTDTTANGTAGYTFIENTELHYVDANGDERYKEGAAV